MTGLAKFEIQLDAVGRDGSVKVNGEDVSKLVSGLLVRAGPGEMTIVELAIVSGDTHIEGEGIVQVNGSDGIIEFLDGIEPEALDHETLRRGDLGTMTVMTVLQVLKEWARGHHPA